MIRYRLECSLRFYRKNQYRIYIRQDSMSILRTIVTPYFHSSMLYKITSMSYKKSKQSCFYIGIDSNFRLSTGYRVKASFQIGLHEKDRALLELIQVSLGVGKITKQGKESVQSRVQSFKELEVILSSFDKQPLITQKRANYILFKQAFLLIMRKEHLTDEGLNKLVAIKSSMNRGLSVKFK